MRPIVFLMIAAVLGGAALADEPARRYQVVTVPGEGVVAAAINERGDVVGLESIEDREHPGIVGQVPFYARGGEKVRIPLLEGYTTASPAAVSDDGVVVGHLGKPISFRRFVPLVTQAFVWDARGGIRGLGVLEGDSASYASGIARDGRRISGYSIGRDRKRACVWDREGDGWKGTPLPQAGQLRSTVVAISGDGRHVASVDADVPCLWTRDDSGRWSRERIGDAGSLVPRAVNNAGMIAGVRYTPDGRVHAAAWSRSGGIRLLTKPPGYVQSEAHALNNHGVIVGMIDGPAGSPIGPNAFADEGGRLRIFDEGGPRFGSATAINDRGQVTGVFEDREEPSPADPARKDGKP